jgi:hypothetical protein
MDQIDSQIFADIQRQAELHADATALASLLLKNPAVLSLLSAACDVILAVQAGMDGTNDAQVRQQRAADLISRIETLLRQ